ncbi:MAG: ABC transporter ATP-binding protein [Anaerolineales bacterium]|nr:ABC transporter ATP-binding protein [Anaerolineales bacterium]
MIRVEDLVKKFEDFVAVDTINLDVGEGEVLALLGPNGAGKTTTVRMLTSVLKPTSGKAYVAGFDVESDPKAVRSSVGVLTESHGLYHRMKAEEYLAFFGQLYGMDQDRLTKRIAAILEKFALVRFSQRRVGEYSKGMRQKLALARAMLHDPKVLLLDEPTSAMDPESARLVRNMIRDLRSEERTVLICTHNLAEAEELADRIAIIREGIIIENGTSTTLREKLLGSPKFEIQFIGNANGILPPDFPGFRDFALNENKVTYVCDDPVSVNPAMVRYMMDAGLDILRVQEVRQSLEEVYLEAVANHGGRDE